MKLLLYGINYAPELTGAGKYTGELAPWLASRGHQVRVITAPPYYPDWKIAFGFSSWAYKKQLIGNVKVYRCPLYVPSKPTTLKRILHLISFAFSSMFVMLHHFLWKPDAVITITPTLFCAPLTILVAKLARAKTILHIQDFEIDALFGLGGRSENQTYFAHKGQNLIFFLERQLYRHFDKISTISSGMMKRALKKGVDSGKLLFFPNWSEIDLFASAQRDDKLLLSLGIPPNKKIILYSGNVGEKQGLEILIEAAKSLEEDHSLFFLVVGEGAAKNKIVTMALELGTKNVLFHPLLPKEILPTLLASVDCHLIIQKRGAADAVLPSKLTNILATGGNSVITADPETTLGTLCSEFPNIAVCVQPESVAELIGGIKKALCMPQPNKVAFNYARLHLDKEKILMKFEADILNLTKEG